VRSLGQSPGSTETEDARANDEDGGGSGSHCDTQMRNELQVGKMNTSLQGNSHLSMRLSTKESLDEPMNSKDFSPVPTPIPALAGRGRRRQRLNRTKESAD
jgi:hypothetical protein